jgi:hypothetical protein
MEVWKRDRAVADDRRGYSLPPPGGFSAFLKNNDRAENGTGRIETKLQEEGGLKEGVSPREVENNLKPFFKSFQALG